MRNFVVVTSIFMVFFISCSQKPKIPDYIDRMEAIPLPAANPMEAPDDWLLAHIDVETTGLLPGFHEMIDIGLVMTDLQGEILDSLFLRVQPLHPENLSEGAYNSNAFNHEKWKKLGALSHIAAVDSILAFHKKIAGDKSVLMVAYNCQFDAAFLDHLFRSANKTWREMYHYFILDIPSMAWGLGLTDLNGDAIMSMYDVPDEPHIAEFHTGITGALVNVRIYKALLRYRAETLASGPGASD